MYSVGGLISRVHVPYRASIGDPGWFGFSPTNVGNLQWLANAGHLSGQWQIPIGPRSRGNLSKDDKFRLLGRLSGQALHDLAPK